MKQENNILKNEERIELIKEVIANIRPFINRDGGDLAFSSLDHGIVYITLLGACTDCGLQDVTLGYGIKNIIMDEIPGIIDVKLTNVDSGKPKTNNITSSPFSYMLDDEFDDEFEEL